MRAIRTSETPKLFGSFLDPRRTANGAALGVAGRIAAAAIVAMSLAACPSSTPDPTSGPCCNYTGPVVHDCAAIENLGPGADLDGRCNQVNQSQSCAWNYSTADCCDTAVSDGIPGDVTCGAIGPSGECCRFTGPVAHDCAAIENLGPGADLDGRCNAVNQSNSCAWYYGADGCCETAVNDGFPGGVVCP